MTVTDPRGRYDDLFTDRRARRVDAETFAALEGNEAFAAGWVVATVVLDDAGRVLLAYHSGDEAWLVPGGSVQPGESLREAAVREVREETGVSVAPDRPHAVVEHVVRHGDASRSFRLVVLSARATSREIGSDLGKDGGPIEEADWFDELLDEVYERELAGRCSLARSGETGRRRLRATAVAPGGDRREIAASHY